MKNDDSNYKQIFSKFFNKEQKMLQYLERNMQSVKHRNTFTQIADNQKIKKKTDDAEQRGNNSRLKVLEKSRTEQMKGLTLNRNKTH